MAWAERLMNAFRRGRLDAEIDEELQFHIEQRTRDNVAAGMTSDRARRDAERRLGGLLRTRERTRDADLLVWLETIGQDVRYAVRNMRHSPVVTLVVVASLALAIGASTAMFSVVQAVLLRRLPYAASNRLVMMWTADLLNGSLEQNTSVPNIEDWKARARSFDEMAVYRESKEPLVDLTPSGLDTDWIRYAFVGDTFFSLLGRSAVLGRVLTREDFTTDQRVAVMTRSLWERRFGGSADAIGKRVSVGGLAVEIVGVMPADFRFPTKDVDLWVPQNLDPVWRRVHNDRGTRYGIVFGRLRAGATLDQARTEMHSVAAQLRQQYRTSNADLDVNLVPLQEQVLGKSVPFMLELLFGAVSCVLLIACANVANLLLARGVARRREMALRAALGAGRWRIVRQLLTESVLLSCSGGCLGLIGLAWSMRALVGLAPSTIPRLDQASVDNAVLLFSLVLSITTGVVFGLVPAARMSRDSGEDFARGATRNVAGGRSSTARRVLVVGQFALALVLLSGAGLFLRSLFAVQSVDSGFDDPGVVTAHLRFDSSLADSRRVALYQAAMERIRRLPGVRAAGAVGTMFWNGEGGRFGLRAVDGHPDKPRDQWDALTWTTIGGDYFQAIGVPLLRGRFFEDTDSKDGPPVVLINETMARRYWPGEDPVGRRIKGFDARGKNDDWVTVVGVVKDVHSQGLERRPPSQIFEAQSQSLDETENLVISGTTATPDALRHTIHDLDRTAVLSDVSTVGARLSEQTAQRRFQTYLLIAFAVFALLLAATGIFATMHYWVVQRTQEIGLRMALGAERRTVLEMVFWETLWMTVVGVGVGLAGALAATRTLTSLLFGVNAHDPVTFVAVSVGLTAIAMIASGIPAVRAVRVDPMLALRID